MILFPFVFFLVYWATSITTASLSRYLYPMLPFFYIMMATAGIYLWNLKPARRGIVISGMMLLLFIVVAKAIMGSNAHGLAVQNITGMQVSIGQTLPTFTEPSDTVATNDIGAIGYFSERYIVDLVGLVSPVRSFDENLSETHPAVLAIFDSWFPNREESDEFVNNYKFLAKVGLTNNIVCGDSVMTIYARADKFDEFVARLEAVPLEGEAKPN
jgi:hypothetical protein